MLIIIGFWPRWIIRKNKLEANNSQVSREREELSKLRKDYEGLKKLLDRERKKVISQAKKEASQILSDANKQVEKTIRDIREVQADKAKTKKIRSALQSYEAEIQKNTTDDEPQIVEETKSLSIGDKVVLDEDTTVGEVLSLKRKAS